MIQSCTAVPSVNGATDGGDGDDGAFVAVNDAIRACTLLDATGRFFFANDDGDAPLDLAVDIGDDGAGARDERCNGRYTTYRRLFIGSLTPNKQITIDQISHGTMTRDTTMRYSITMLPFDRCTSHHTHMVTSTLPRTSSGRSRNAGSGYTYKMTIIEW